MIVDWQTLKAAIADARTTLTSVTRSTPLIFSPGLSARCAGPIYLKLENLQYSGSFKYRPAIYNILTELEAAQRCGVVTASSGNFACAVAMAAKRNHVAATVVARPSIAPFKLARIKRFGADVIICDDDYASRENVVEEMAESQGMLRLHPHGSVATIAGDATVGFEIIEHLPDTARIVVPTSGAGLLSGIAMAVQQESKPLLVYGAQPKANGTLKESLRLGRRQGRDDIQTVADGLTAAIPGKLGFEIAKRHVQGVATVSEESLIEATRLVFEEEGQIIEPAGAAGLASILEGSIDCSVGPTVLVVSGGNVSPNGWARWVEQT